MPRTHINKILIWAGIILLLLLIFFPVYWGIRTSLQAGRTLNTEFFPELTLDHYRTLFNPKGQAFGNFIKNSALVSIGAVIGTIPLAMLGGYALARFEFPGKRYSIILLVLPLMPAIAVLVPLIVYMRILHLYNTLYAVIIATVVFNLPFTTWMTRGFMLTIPRELEEAAMLDGCGALGVLWRIALPLAAPGLISVGIFVLIAGWNTYLFSFAFTSSQDLQIVPAAILSFITAFGTNYAGMNAAATMAMLPPLCFFLIFQKWFVQGLLAGSHR